MDEHGTVEYASWGQRLGAVLLDAALTIVLPTFALGILLAITVGPDDDPATDDSAAYGVLGGIIFFPLSFFYFWLFHGSARGQTLGKRVVGIAVRRADTGGRLGYRLAAARALVFGVTLAVFPLWLIDCLWPLWDKQRQALHDKVGSVVVRTS